MISTDPATSIDFASLKSGGIIMQRDDDFFAIRLKLIGGTISALQLRRIADIVEKHGRD